MKKTQTPEELAPATLTVKVKAHIVRDLQLMEKITKQSVDDLVSKALLMFIATHNDFLGKSRN